MAPRHMHIHTGECVQILNEQKHLKYNRKVVLSSQNQQYPRKSKWRPPEGKTTERSSYLAKIDNILENQNGALLKEKRPKGRLDWKKPNISSKTKMAPSLQKIRMQRVQQTNKKITVRTTLIHGSVRH